MKNQSTNHKEQHIQPSKKLTIPPKDNPYTLKINDTTVHLHFNGAGTLTAHIANAFNSMLS